MYSAVDRQSQNFETIMITAVETVRVSNTFYNLIKDYSIHLTQNPSETLPKGEQVIVRIE